MKKLLFVLSGVVLMASCGTEEEQNNQSGNDTPQQVSLELCDCVTPSEENKAACAEQFPAITETERALCNGDSLVLSDTVSQEVKDSIREDYENDLSLEIKVIEEEKEDPISDECKLFLEEYAEAIKDFTDLVDRVNANPDDIPLQIQLSSQSEEINSWASRPQMFQCSQNAAFQKQVEILNGKRDKLLTM